MFTEFVQTVTYDRFIVSCWRDVARRDQLIQEQLFLQQHLFLSQN